MVPGCRRVSSLSRLKFRSGTALFAVLNYVRFSPFVHEPGILVSTVCPPVFPPTLFGGTPHRPPFEGHHILGPFGLGRQQFKATKLGDARIHPWEARNIFSPGFRICGTFPAAFLKLKQYWAYTCLSTVDLQGPGGLRTFVTYNPPTPKVQTSNIRSKVISASA